MKQKVLFKAQMVGAIKVENKLQNSGADQSPAPGGDPDPPPSDLPVPRKGGSIRKSQGEDKTGYGHIAKEETPRPEGAPKPHQIY
jgi:hypothetical protein